MDSIFVLILMAGLGAVFHVLRSILHFLPFSEAMGKRISPGQAFFDKVLDVQRDIYGNYRVDSVHNLIIAILSGVLVGIVLMSISPDYFDPLVQILKSGLSPAATEKG